MTFCVINGTSSWNKFVIDWYYEMWSVPFFILVSSFFRQLRRCAFWNVTSVKGPFGWQPVLKHSFLSFSSFFFFSREHNFHHYLSFFQGWFQICSLTYAFFLGFQGITFDEFRSFFQFLNNLEDFAIAMQMYNFASRSIGQGRWRAVTAHSCWGSLHTDDAFFPLSLVWFELNSF